MAKPQLKIRRGTDWYGAGLSMKILANDKEVGIAPGGAPNDTLIDLPSAGHYRICFRLDGCTSAEYDCNIADDERVTLRAVLPEKPLLSQIFSRNRFGMFVTERQLPEKI